MEYIYKRPPLDPHLNHLMLFHKLITCFSKIFFKIIPKCIRPSFIQNNPPQLNPPKCYMNIDPKYTNYLVYFFSCKLAADYFPFVYHLYFPSLCIVSSQLLPLGQAGLAATFSTVTFLFKSVTCHLTLQFLPSFLRMLQRVKIKE